MTLRSALEKLSTVLGDVGRARKPRGEGITILLDKGLGVNEIDDLASVAGSYIDFAKIAWASALITRNLEQKITAYFERGITPLLGGTLFEYAYLHGRVPVLLEVARESKLHVEISDGVASIPRREKLEWLSRFAAVTEVFSEVGRKIGQEHYDWRTVIREELSAGAKKVVIEGREIGPVGQEIRGDLVDLLVEVAPVRELVFEALERKQQVWLIDRLGANVNLGNILPSDLLTVEAFRQGLKEHTMLATFERSRG